ncbi:efflux RND transporter permease subunit [Reinekea thalattae]|uniref:Efflux RND transporter permease subunit n=2 Tax=Reinekea thalattae TaxID=2593301 RepID=A0A5C8ZB38_9GAMM|nr:efflux RND transporter permease subunit [Reinekea thalattae]
MNSYFPPILMLLALVIGAVALWLTPREEDPQIVVPMADLIISAPGLSARQIEKQITEPLEQLLKQVDGVEYVYSTSSTGQAIVIARFEVGQERENSLVKLYNKVYSHQDLMPPSVTNWLIKPVEIDDVPIFVAALYSTDADQVDEFELRRLAEEASQRLQSVDKSNNVQVIGGSPRQINIELDAAALASRKTTIDDVAFALGVNNQRQQAGSTHVQGRSFEVQSGSYFRDADDVGASIVNVIDGRPVYLRDIAKIQDGADEPASYSWFSKGPAFALGQPDGVSQGSVLPASAEPYPAVFIAAAKQKGSNAVWVANDLLQELEQIQQQQFPEAVQFSVIRDYGQTANDKVSNLISSLAVSVLTVVVFVGLFLNWRSALVVGIAIPISYGAALAMDLAFGYSINRVTLFALILALGLIVDDPIASIDNIERYLNRKGMAKASAIVAAMAEIRGALLMSTVAIVIVFTPMLFITGMMGPYMAPMAFNVPISVVFSTVVAFFITPWLAKKIIVADNNPAAQVAVTETGLYRFYQRILTPFLTSRRASWILLSVVALLFVVAAMLPTMRWVPLKLLPYDNKNEFQLVVDLPESASLESTANLLQDMDRYLRTVPEVASVSAFAGIASPMDFNGLVRHYFLRSNESEGELRVVLADKKYRDDQSHALTMKLRDDLQAIADNYQAHMQLVETPPGPPVIATVVAEVYGEDNTAYEDVIAAADIVAERLKREPSAREVDTSAQLDYQRWRFEVDREKAALSGVSIADINAVISAANDGRTLSYLQDENEVFPTPIHVRLASDSRDQLEQIKHLYVRAQAGVAKTLVAGSLVDAPQALVQIGELGEFVLEDVDQPIFHKNLKPVVYVYAEAVGRVPAEIVVDTSVDKVEAASEINNSEQPRALGWRNYFANGGDDYWSVPEDISVVWNGEGEWKITLNVFRDMGIAYGVALIGVYIVLMLQTGLPTVAGIIMLAIPLTVVGIMPGFLLLNNIGTTEIANYPNPVLFTATAMIGMIALAGIVVRNSLVLIEFIHQSLAEGMALKQALIEAGAVRMRPILLTAGTTMLGNIVITLDPIFNGLAWAIMFGITASTLFTLVVIPVVYNLAYGNLTNSQQNDVMTEGEKHV